MMTTSKSTSKKHTCLVLLTVVLWLASAVFGFFLIIPVLDSVITIYVAFLTNANPISQASFLGMSIWQFGVLFLAILYVIGIIGGAEHCTRNFNTPAAWQFMFSLFTVEFTLYLFTILF